MKKPLKYGLLILLVLAVYSRYFYYHDFSAGCGITIKPSLTELSSQNIKAALRAMKHGAPNEYALVCKHVESIDPNLACGGFNGGCFYLNDLAAGEIDVSTGNQSYLGWTAAVIAHETCHLIQAKEGRTMDEGECYGVGNDILKKMIVFKL
jgi:hypothetical protein